MTHPLRALLRHARRQITDYGVIISKFFYISIYREASSLKKKFSADWLSFEHPAWPKSQAFYGFLQLAWIV